MPPRIPARALSTLPLSNGAVASSSTLPPPPHRAASTSPRQPARSIHTARSAPRSELKSPPTTFKRSFHSSSTALAKQKNPYEVLGVKKDATAPEIKKSYYQLAKKWHPDSNKDKGAQERFVEIQTAYDILSDDSKRQAYDQYGSASQEEGFDPNFARGAGGFGGFQGFGGGFQGGAGNTGDLFESLFGSAFGGGGGGAFGGAGGGAGRNRPVRGDDIEVNLTLSFLEACQGVTRKVTLSPVVDCKPCTGSGLKPGQTKSTCTVCRGTGQQTFQIQGMFMSSTCQTCGGAGSTIPRSARCGECDGLGRVKERTDVEVDIPAGVEDNMKVKLPGKGDMPLSSKGPPGDLFVRVNVKASPVFRRQGSNIYHDAKVPLHTALLGGRVRIPTLEGDVEVRVREGTQNGEEAVLKGRGVKNVYGLSRERGDLVVGWKIQIPRSLSPFQKKLMRAFADDIEGRDPQVYFGAPPPPFTSSTSSSPSGTSEASASASEAKSSGTTYYPPRSESPSSTSPRSPHNPYQEPIEPEYRGPRTHEDTGLVGKVASAVGGALGFLDGLFGKKK